MTAKHSSKTAKQTGFATVNQDALRRLVKTWETHQVGGLRELFTAVARMRLPTTELGAGLADEATTQALVRNLRTASWETRGTLPTAYAAQAMLDAIRPLPGAKAQLSLVPDLGLQLSTLQETLSQRLPSRLPGLTKVVEEQLRASEAWSRPLRDFGEAVQRLVEEQRRLDERTDAFIRRHAWPVPRNLPEISYRKVMNLVDLPKREVNRLMVEVSARAPRPTSPPAAPSRKAPTSSQDVLSSDKFGGPSATTSGTSWSTGFCRSSRASSPT